MYDKRIALTSTKCHYDIIYTKAYCTKYNVIQSYDDFDDNEINDKSRSDKEGSHVSEGEDVDMENSDKKRQTKSKIVRKAIYFKAEDELAHEKAPSKDPYSSISHRLYLKYKLLRHHVKDLGYIM